VHFSQGAVSWSVASVWTAFQLEQLSCSLGVLSLELTIPAVDEIQPLFPNTHAHHEMQITHISKAC